MTEHTRVRSRSGLALILTLLLMFAAACKSTADSDSSSSGPSGGTSVVTSAPTTGSGETQKICGAPPCVRYVSRGDTKTLSDTIADHPILSTVALHAAVMVLCGGILCLLGEGISLDYVGHAAKDAESQHACMKVNIMTDDDKWKLATITTSNQSPYCKD